MTMTTLYDDQMTMTTTTMMVMMFALGKKDHEMFLRKDLNDAFAFTVRVSLQENVNKSGFITENKRVHHELRRAAADVARLQKKARKGEYFVVKAWKEAYNPIFGSHPWSS